MVVVTWYARSFMHSVHVRYGEMQPRRSGHGRWQFTYMDVVQPFRSLLIIAKLVHTTHAVHSCECYFIILLISQRIEWTGSDVMFHLCNCACRMLHNAFYASPVATVASLATCNAMLVECTSRRKHELFGVCIRKLYIRNCNTCATPISYHCAGYLHRRFSVWWVHKSYRNFSTHKIAQRNCVLHLLFAESLNHATTCHEFSPDGYG